MVRIGSVRSRSRPRLAAWLGESKQLRETYILTLTTLQHCPFIDLLYSKLAEGYSVPT